MKSPIPPAQRIGRLAPLAEVFAAVDANARPLPPCVLAVGKAFGSVLAADVVAPEASPAAPVADRDGWAVRADDVAGAGPYAPVLPTVAPAWVDAGATMPPGCDAVAAPDALLAGADGTEVIAPAGPGEGVRPAGSDAAPGMVLLPAGRRLRASDLALLLALGIERVPVRTPRIAVVAATARAAATAQAIAAAAAREGARVELSSDPGQDFEALSAANPADALVVVGGTGQGRADRSALALAAAGRLLLHGMGIRPGETAGFGVVGERPVLLLPGRIDAALAVWLLVGRRLLDRLAAAADKVPASSFTLSRKLAGTVGLAEIVLVGRSGEGVEPCAAGTFPLQALAQAVGWALVPPESEGYPSGTILSVNPLP